MEQNENVINKDMCEEMESKYNKMLLSVEEQSALSNKIMVYYQLKEQFIKQNVKKCPLCGNKIERPNIPISDIFTSTYNTQTYCKELQIKCISKKKCQGMIIKYGIVFNLNEQSTENKKILDAIKNQIIINKNNLLYGLIDEPDGINIHNTLLEQLQNITNIYKTQLYHVLFYTNNQHMNTDIQQMRNDIKHKIMEIKEYIIKENYEKVIENYIDIMNLHKCLISMNKYKSTIYSEQLFKCDSDIPMEHTPIPDLTSVFDITKDIPKKKHIKKTLKNKHSHLTPQPSPQPFAQSPPSQQQPDNKSDKNHKKIDKINHILNHMFLIFDGDFIDELIKDDKTFIEQVYLEMMELNKIIKYATKEQQDQYNIIAELYENKIQELNWSPDQMTQDQDESNQSSPLHIDQIPLNDTTLRDKFDSSAIELNS